MRKIAVCFVLFILIFNFAYAENTCLEDMLSTLSSLGINVNPDAIVDIEASIAEVYAYMPENLHDQIDLYDYEYVLSYIGMGNYDANTDTFVPYTNDMYAFDSEAYDLIAGYEDLLDAIERMSKGEVIIEDFSAEMTDRLFNVGYGKLPIKFTMNGEKCEYRADFQTDWMDCEIIDYVNRCLKNCGISNCIWSMYDGGQGLILFYNDAQWVREFEMVTGYELEKGTGSNLSLEGILDLFL